MNDSAPDERREGESRAARPRYPEEGDASAPPPAHRLNTSRTRPARRRRPLPPPPGAAEERQRHRLGRWTLLLGVLVGVSVIGAALLARQERASAPSGPASATTALRASDPSALTPVQVRGVVDGATLDVAALQTPLRVRLLGVEPPDPASACAAPARQRLAELAGDEVRLRADAVQRDAAGDELRYVYTPDGRSIDATLVSEGLERASRDPGALRDRLVALEDAARAARRGCLWSGN